nr:EOG090X0FOW [Eulimnadia texana]
MASEGNDYFSVGSIVSCRTCYNEEIEGEVLAYDVRTKMLILKCSAATGRPLLYDVHVVNLSQVSNVDVKKEATSPPPPHPVQNVEKLKKRARSELDKKRYIIKALTSGATHEGVKLYNVIKKTRIDDVVWEGQNIKVMDSVVIHPPYMPENVTGSESKAVTHVRKIIEKHLKDQQQTLNSSGSSNSDSTQSFVSQ